MAKEREIFTRYTIQDQVHTTNILIVEDDILSMNFLEAQIAEYGHTLFKARDGQEALDILHQNPDEIDIVLMDREMPVMDGLKAIRKMKSDPQLRKIPVIMVTSADQPDDMKEGLNAGVFYYLTKPVNPQMLGSVLSAAIREAEQSRALADELGRHRTSFHLIDTCKFKLRTLDEAEHLAAFIANCFPDPERVLPGIGELLVNAIEHGNLGVGYNQKTTLLNNGTWRAEINRLQTLPQNEHKYVTVTLAHKEDGIYVVIEDQGAGFAWKKYMQIDPARAGDNHGRGIAQANIMSFDKLTYNDSGNIAVGYVGHEKQLEW